MEPPQPHLPLKCCFVPVPVCRARQDTSPTDLWAPSPLPAPPQPFLVGSTLLWSPLMTGGRALGRAGRKSKRGRGSVQKTPISSHPPVLFPGCDIHLSAQCTAAPTPTLPRLVTAALHSALGRWRSGLSLEFTSVLPRSAQASVPVGLTVQDSSCLLPLRPSESPWTDRPAPPACARAGPVLGAGGDALWGVVPGDSGTEDSTPPPA